MQKARSHTIQVLLPLVSVRFQVLFHPLIQGTFHLSLTVLVHYRSLSYIQPYQMVLADSHQISPVSCYSGYHYVINPFPIRDFHPLWSDFPVNSSINLQSMSWSYNPNIAVTILVWANPRSLATTYGITFVFFSSRYLDVSVLWVCFIILMIPLSRWVAPFGYLRVNGCVHLVVAFRSLSRPSSLLRAQASPVRPLLLITYLCLLSQYVNELNCDYIINQYYIIYKNF